MDVLIFSNYEYVDDTDEQVSPGSQDNSQFTKQPLSCFEKLNLKGKATQIVPIGKNEILSAKILARAISDQLPISIIEEDDDGDL